MLAQGVRLTWLSWLRTAKKPSTLMTRWSSSRSSRSWLAPLAPEHTHSRWAEMWRSCSEMPSAPRMLYDIEIQSEIASGTI